MESQTQCTVLYSLVFNYWIEGDARIAFQVIMLFLQLNSSKQGKILMNAWFTEMKTIIPI